MERQSPSAEGELTEEKPVNVHAHSWDSSADAATFARAVGSVRRKTLYAADTNAFRRRDPYPPGNKFGKTAVVSATSNFRMSIAPVNSYPCTYVSTPLFRNYNGRSKEALELF